MIKALFNEKSIARFSAVTDWLAQTVWYRTLPLIVVTLSVWFGLVILDFNLRGENLPWGILSLEIPPSAEYAWSSIRTWVYAQHQATVASIRLDYIFIVCYTLLLCRWGWWLKRAGKATGRGKWAAWIAGCVNVMFTMSVIAGVCDFFENINMMAMITLAEQDEVVRAASMGYLAHTAFFRAYLITKACAIVKFVCLGIVVLLGGFATAWWWSLSGRMKAMWQ